MIYILLTLIAFSFIWQPTEGRRFAAIVYGLFYAVHALIGPHLEAEQFFFSGAILDMVIIYILATMKYQEMNAILQMLCVYSIINNYLAWQLWNMYAPPTICNNIFVAIYAASLLTLIFGGPDGWRAFKDRWSTSWVFGAYNSGALQGVEIRREEEKC